jgi:peptidoglycan/LPS O-acetylase OafA/YrhL
MESPQQQNGVPEKAASQRLTLDMSTPFPKDSTYVQPTRIESLDTIRGLAALAVLLGHNLGLFAWPNGMVSWAKFPLVNIFFDGRSAVTMFFVLSGFVLSRPYLTKTPTQQNYRQLFIPTFYLRRLTRIWIPWFSIFCFSVVMRACCFHSYQTAPPMSEQFKQFWSGDLTTSSFFRQCAFMLQDGPHLVPQDWTLRIELKGSVLVPAFIFLARWHILPLFGAGALLLIFVPTGSYYFSFVLGVFAAKCFTSVEPSMRRISLTSKCGILALGVILYQTRLATNYLWGADSVIADQFAWCICSIGCVIVITASLCSKRIQSALSYGMFVFLGRISYSVFLLQIVVLLCLLPPAIRVLNIIGVRNLVVLLPLTFVIAVFVTVAIAAITYRVIEVPSMALGHRVSSYIQRQFLRRSANSETRQKPPRPTDAGESASSQNDQSPAPPSARRDPM